MARNSLAGKSTGKSKSARYFASNPDARRKKQAYDAVYSSSEERKRYRTKLNAANRKSHAAGKSKVGDKKDQSHTRSNKLKLEAQSKNRGRAANAKKGKSTKL